MEANAARKSDGPLEWSPVFSALMLALVAGGVAASWGAMGSEDRLWAALLALLPAGVMARQAQQDPAVAMKCRHHLDGL